MLQRLDTDCAARNLLNVNDITIFRVAKITTLKSAKVLSYSDLRDALNVTSDHSPVSVSAVTSCPPLCQTPGIISRCRPSGVTAILRHSRSCHHAEAWHQYLKSRCRKRNARLFGIRNAHEKIRLEGDRSRVG